MRLLGVAQRVDPVDDHAQLAIRDVVEERGDHVAGARASEELTTEEVPDHGQIPRAHRPDVDPRCVVAPGVTERDATPSVGQGRDTALEVHAAHRVEDDVRAATPGEATHVGDEVRTRVLDAVVQAILDAVAMTRAPARLAI